VPDTSSNLSDGIVRIHLQPALALTDRDCIVVLFLGANVPEKNSCESSVPLSSGFLVSASDKKVADLYINGSYSPALNGPAQYSIDSFVTLAWDLPGEKKSVGPSTDKRTDVSVWGRLGFSGQVNTDKRKAVDPDSYSFSPLFQKILLAPPQPRHLQGILLNYSFAKVEFDRKANDLNFVTAPTVEFPMRLLPFSRPISRTTRHVAILTPILGVELGNNFSNLLRSDGQGLLFRALVGADATYNYKPKLLFFQGFSITSSYRLRLPAVDEIFTTVSQSPKTNQAVDNPALTTKPRHSVQSELDLFLTKAFALTITHQYGDLPPVFRLVDQKVSIGLTFMLSQSDGVRGAIRKN